MVVVGVVTVLVLLSSNRFTGRMRAAGSSFIVRLRSLAVNLRLAADSVALFAKLKICLGFAQVVAQIGDVYQLRYPSGYQSISSQLFSPLRLQIFGWIPGMHLSCLGLRSLFSELLLMTVAPAVVVLVALMACYCRRRSMLSVLPFVLRWTYLVHPSISSKGFQVLGGCECFPAIMASVDGRNATSGGRSL